MYSVEDWGPIIDATWGPPNLNPFQRQALFYDFWTIMDEDYACFQDLDVDWDAVEARYGPEVTTDISRGRFAAIMSHMARALKESHTRADDQGVSTDEDTPVEITLTGSDVDGDALTFEVVDGPTNGALSGSGANLTYTPDADYNGPDSFTFRANDGTADSNLATVSISVAGGSYALSFDGSDDIVRAAQVPGSGPLTIEAWVRPDDNNANGLMIVGADDYGGWSLELNGGQFTLWLSTNQGWQYVQHSTALQAGQWYHVAATYENGTVRVFVDGIASTATNVGAGARSLATTRWRGRLSLL